MADHSRPRHRRKCPACTRFMRSGDNHLHMCRSCHGCTVDNKCDICSRWTHQVWVGIVERSTARHNKKQRVISEAPASDIPSTPPHPALGYARSHKRARLQTSSMSSGSFHGFSPAPSPEITQDRDRESVLAEILQLLREQRVLPTVVSDAANRPCAQQGNPHPYMEVHVRGFTPTGPLRAEHRTLLSGPKPETRSTLRSRRETRKLTPFDSGHRSTGKSRGRTEKTRDSPRCGSGLRAIGENSDLPTAGAEPENRSSLAE